MLDEKLTSRVFRLYSHKLHKQRLNDIKSKISTRINNSVPRTLKYQQIKRSGYASQTRERKTNINRENEKIFQIISQISDGKRASSIYSMCESLKPTPKPRSLNMTSRKKEAQRIVEDNYALAKRLSESTRGVSFKRFDDEWQNTTKYMNSISKRNIRKLPKLDELNKYMHSVPSSDIGSKKAISLKSPVTETHKNNFSPNFNSSLPGSVLEVANEDKDTPKGNQNILKKELVVGSQGRKIPNDKESNDNKTKNQLDEKETSLERLKGQKDQDMKNGKGNFKDKNSFIENSAKSNEKNKKSQGKLDDGIESVKEKQGIHDKNEHGKITHQENEKESLKEDLYENKGKNLSESEEKNEKSEDKNKKTDDNYEKSKENREDIKENSEEILEKPNDINLNHDGEKLEKISDVSKPSNEATIKDQSETRELPKLEIPNSPTQLAGALKIDSLIPGTSKVEVPLTP